MRILHVIHTLNPASGGTAEAVRNFVLHPEGSEQAVLTLDHASDPWTKSFSSEVQCVGPGKGQYGYTPQLRHWLRENLSLYDAAVIHGCWQYHGLALSEVARALGTPYFIFPHGMLDPYFNETSRAKHLKKLLYWRWERRVLENARAVLFTCEEEQKRAHQAFGFNTTDEIVPLGMAAPTVNLVVARNEFFARYPQVKGKRALLFLGRLHPKKGIDLLIQAFADICDPSLHLLIIGPAEDDTYASKLKRLAAPCASAVTFTGILTGRLKTGALAAGEILALPSHQENFGLSVVEALAFGRPVLLSDKVNIWREIVRDGAGFAAPDTLPGVTELLRNWQSLSGPQIATMSRAAQLCFESRFRAETASAKFLATLHARDVSPHEQPSLQFEPACG